jgi:hypothetical protein
LREELFINTVRVALTDTIHHTGPAEILVMSRVMEQTDEMKILAGLSQSWVGDKSIEIVQ